MLPADIKSVDVIRKLAQQWRMLTPEQKQVFSVKQYQLVVVTLILSRPFFLFSFFSFYIAVSGCLSSGQGAVQGGPPALPGPAVSSTAPATSPGEKTKAGQEEGHPKEEGMRKHSYTLFIYGNSFFYYYVCVFTGVKQPGEA